MPPESTDLLDDDGADGSLGAADDTAADSAVDTAVDDAGDTAGEATGTEATTDADSTAEGAETEQSEAGQRKLPTARQPATSPNQPTKPGQPPKAAPDPQKTFLDEKAAWGRERAAAQKQQQELAARVKQFEDGEQRRKAEADKLALKQWHPQHPESMKAKERIGRVKAYMSALDALPPEAQTPETKAKLAQRLGVTNEDAKLHDEYEAHRDDVVNRLSQDPEGFLDQRVQQVVPRLIQDAFNQFFAHQRAELDVQRMMADPTKIAPHADMIRERLQTGSSLKDVMEIVELKNRLTALEGGTAAVAGKDAEVSRREKAAAERERLSKGNAAITRDPKTGGKPDFYSMAIKESASHANDRSWQPGGQKFNRHLAALEDAHRKAADP